ILLRLLCHWRLIRLFQTPSRRQRRFRKRSAGCVQRRPILVQGGIPILLQIEYAAQINMRPGDHFGSMGRLQGSFKVEARPFHVPIRGGDFRQNEERASGIFFLLIERLLRQLLRAFLIARRQPPFRVQQQVLVPVPSLQQFGRRLAGKLDVVGPLRFFANLNLPQQVRISIAYTGGTLIEFAHLIIKIARQDVSFLVILIDVARSLGLRNLAQSLFNRRTRHSVTSSEMWLLNASSIGAFSTGPSNGSSRLNESPFFSANGSSK